MNQIFWGLIFLFFNISINGLSLLPSFVGYILIIFGAGKWPQVAAFRQAKPAAVVGAVVTGLYWLPGASFGGAVDFLAAPVGLFCQLFVTWKLARGVQELEETLGAGLKAAPLRKAWMAMTALLGLAYVLSVLASMPNLGIVFMVAGFVAAVVYIVIFYQSKKLLAQVTAAEPWEKKE